MVMIDKKKGSYSATGKEHHYRTIPVIKDPFEEDFKAWRRERDMREYKKHLRENSDRIIRKIG